MCSLMTTEYRANLAPEDVAALSIEMRCCYLLNPWNNSMTATTVEGWAHDMRFYVYGDSDTSFEDQVQMAVDSANELIEFVKDVVADRDEIIACLEAKLKGKADFEEMVDARERYLSQYPE